MISPRNLAVAMGLHDGAAVPRDRRHLAHHDRVALVGCVMDMSRPRPSFPEVGAAMGCAHSTVHSLWHEWLEWDWRIRYGWLQQAERAVRELRDRKEAAA